MQTVLGRSWAEVQRAWELNVVAALRDADLVTERAEIPATECRGYIGSD